MRQDGAALAEVPEPESESGVRAKMAQEDDDPVLAAVRRAPFVPLTASERTLLSEVANRPECGIPHDKFMTMVGLADDKR